MSSKTNRVRGRRGSPRRVSHSAAWALGRLGRVGPAAVVLALCEALKDEDARVRAIASWALGRIDRPARAVPALCNVLAEKDEDIRKQAAWTLEEIGSDLWARDPQEILEKLAAEPQRRATPDQRTVGRHRRSSKSRLSAPGG